MIRPFKEEDRDEYLALSDEFYHSEATDHPVPRENWERTFSAVVNNQYLAKGWMITTAEGQTAGYMLASLAWSGECGGLVGWLEELYLRPEYRGRKMGIPAMEEVMAELKKEGVRGFRLEVAPANTPVEALYKKLGFVPVPYNGWWMIL